MVEQDTRAGKEPVALAVVHRDPVPIDLRHPVRATRVERGQFILRTLPHPTKHFATRRLVKANFRVKMAHRLQQASHPESSKFSREYGLIPRGGHKRLGSQVIHLVRLAFLQRVQQGSLIEQISLDKMESLAQMIDALEALGAGPAYDAGDLVA